MSLVSVQIVEFRVLEVMVGFGFGEAQIFDKFGMFVVLESKEMIKDLWVTLKVYSV